MIRGIKQKVRSKIEKIYDKHYIDEWNLKTCTYEKWLIKQQI